MEELNQNGQELEPVEEAIVPEEDKDGKVIFANDVVATIASLAAVEIEGVSSMNGASGFSGIFGKKDFTKGVKIEVADKIVKADISINVKYGYKIQEVCKNIQAAVKNAVESMTGLNVSEVNVYVKAVEFEKPEPEPEVVEPEAEAEEQE